MRTSIVILFLVFLVAQTRADECDSVDFREIEREMTLAHNVLSFAHNSSFVQTLIRGFDAIQIDSPRAEEAFTKSIFGIKYRVKFQVKTVEMKGLTKVFLKPTKVKSKTTIQVHGESNQGLWIKYIAHVKYRKQCWKLFGRQLCPQLMFWKGTPWHSTELTASVLAAVFPR